LVDTFAGVWCLIGLPWFWCRDLCRGERKARGVDQGEVSNAPFGTGSPCFFLVRLLGEPTWFFDVCRTWPRDWRPRSVSRGLGRYRYKTCLQSCY
jgi:hypothetical protein